MNKVTMNMEYKVSWEQPEKHFLTIEYHIRDVGRDMLEVQLPAWRPGRYELAGFHRNIRTFEVYDTTQFPLSFKKIKKDRWQIESRGVSEVIIKYTYYAAQMDAGGSWLDEELIYFNFINFLLYVPGRESEPCSLLLDIPDGWKTGCGIPFNDNRLEADDLYHLVDSPLLAAPGLKHHSFQVSDVNFNLWFYGDISPVWNVLEKQFSAFANEQIKTMGDFPERGYHFLFLILPYKHYHGVEHRNSTVIVLGPADKFEERDFQEKLLGISSHELFHAWNIIKIRPEEMMPYDFSQENYYRTGYVAEGFTTYYGDAFLFRSGVFTEEQYLKEINLLLKRHFDNFGRFNLSVADSSYDLWIDGYSQGIPNRKVSIYVKGAIIAFMLDLVIRKHSGGQKTLDDVMRKLWTSFGKTGKGYSEQDIKWLCSETAGVDLTDFFSRYVEGTEDEENYLRELVQNTAWTIEKSDNPLAGERIFGLRISSKDGKTEVDATHPGSPADAAFVKDDEIVSVDGIKVADDLHDLLNGKTEVTIGFFRNYKLRELVLKAHGGSYYPVYKMKKRE